MAFNENAKKMLNLYQIHTTEVSPVDAFITFRSLVLFIARLASHVIKSLLKLKMQNINNRKRMLQFMQTYYIATVANCCFESNSSALSISSIVPANSS